MGYLRYETPVSVDTSYDGTVADNTEPTVFNLRRVIQTYAWRRYMKSLPYHKRLGKQKTGHYFVFNWDGLNFKHNTLMTKMDPEDIVLDPVNLCSRQEAGKVRDTNHHSYRSLDIQSPQVINTCRYENITERNEHRLFHTNKETTTRINVEFRECYSLGESTNIHLTVPGKFISPINHNDCRLLATKPRCERFKESVTWSVDAHISVKSGHRATALLSAQEQQTLANFEVHTTASLRSEWLPVRIHRKSDKGLVYTCFVTDLHNVFRRHQGPNVCLSTESLDGGHVSHNVSLVSRGACKIRGWTDVQVLVSAENISSSRPDFLTEDFEM